MIGWEVKHLQRSGAEYKSKSKILSLRIKQAQTEVLAFARAVRAAAKSGEAPAGEIPSLVRRYLDEVCSGELCPNPSYSTMGYSGGELRGEVRKSMAASPA